MCNDCVGGYLPLLSDGVGNEAEGFNAVCGRGGRDGCERWKGCRGRVFGRGGRGDGERRGVWVGEEGGGLRRGGRGGHCARGEGVGVREVDVCAEGGEECCEEISTMTQ